MKKIHSFKDVEFNRIAVSIGNFDGVHIGHRHMISKIIRESENLGLDLVLVTFKPHPIQILKPQENFLINSYDEKEELLSSLGVKYLREINFSRDLSTLGPKDFLESFIYSEKLKKIFIGHDFAFGAGKQGDANFVENYCLEKRIEFKVMDKYCRGDDDVSSSIIRRMILSGNMEGACEFLARNFFITGRVVKGEGRGKVIGFPTANISFNQSRLIPKRGVYVTRTYYRDQIYHSVTNIGYNPTFSNSDNLSVETHILDFNNDIYGETVKVEFLSRIRDEMKFSSVNKLVDQIKIDVTKTKNKFAK